MELSRIIIRKIVINCSIDSSGKKYTDQISMTKSKNNQYSIVKREEIVRNWPLRECIRRWDKCHRARRASRYTWFWDQAEPLWSLPRSRRDRRRWWPRRSHQIPMTRSHGRGKRRIWERQWKSWLRFWWENTPFSLLNSPSPLLLLWERERDLAPCRDEQSRQM